MVQWIETQVPILRIIKKIFNSDTPAAAMASGHQLPQQQQESAHAPLNSNITSLSPSTQSLLDAIAKLSNQPQVPANNNIALGSFNTSAPVNVSHAPDLARLVSQLQGTSPALSNSSFSPLSAPTQTPVQVSPGPNTLPITNLLSQFANASPPAIDSAQSTPPVPPTAATASSSTQSPTPLAQAPTGEASPHPSPHSALHQLNILNQQKAALAAQQTSSPEGILAQLMGTGGGPPAGPPNNPNDKNGPNSNFQPTCIVCKGPHGWASCPMLRGNVAAQEAVCNHLILTKQAQVEREENRQAINLMLLNKGIDPTCFGFNQRKQYSATGLKMFANSSPAIQMPAAYPVPAAAQPPAIPSVAIPSPPPPMHPAQSNDQLLNQLQTLVQALQQPNGSPHAAPSPPTATSPAVPQPGTNAPMNPPVAPLSNHTDSQPSQPPAPAPRPKPAAATEARTYINADTVSPEPELKRGRADRSPDPECTPTPSARRSRAINLEAEEALFRELFNVDSTPAKLVRSEQAELDLLRNESAANTLTIEQLSRQLADLRAGKGKPKRHELGVLDLPARQVLTRSIRAPKAGDLLFAIIPSPTGKYELKHGKVVNVESDFIYFSFGSQVVSDDNAMDDDDDLFVVDKHFAFRDESRANQALVSLNELLN